MADTLRDEFTVQIRLENELRMRENRRKKNTQPVQLFILFISESADMPSSYYFFSVITFISIFKCVNKSKNQFHQLNTFINLWALHSVVHIWGLGFTFRFGLVEKISRFYLLFRNGAESYLPRQWDAAEKCQFEPKQPITFQSFHTTQNNL